MITAEKLAERLEYIDMEFKAGLVDAFTDRRDLWKPMYAFNELVDIIKELTDQIQELEDQINNVKEVEEVEEVEES